MITVSPKCPENPIRVLIIAGFELVKEGLTVLIDGNRDMSVVGTLCSSEDVLRSPVVHDSEVAVFFYSPSDRIETISDLLSVSPHLRVIGVFQRDDLDSQAKAIKLGAVGIVHKEQSSKLLVEAVRQTYKGETWMNQVILNKILLNERGGRAGSLNSPAVRDPDALTPRELEVTRLIGDGLKNKEIATSLSITEATVRHHLSSIYGKVGVEDRLNLVILAHQRGLIKLSPDSHD